MQRIGFNDTYGLTAAVIEGRKNMTRRICKDHALGCEILASEVLSMRFNADDNVVEFLMNNGGVATSVPKYRRGEIVAVAQPYKDLDYSLKGFATNPDRTCGIRREFAQKQAGWNNKMFVSAKFMPHYIRITDVRVERLQDISEEDCLLEGVVRRKEMHPRQEWEPEYTFGDGKYHAQNPRAAFAALIDKPGVGGKGTWERNPWCVAYTFKLNN